MADQTVKSKIVIDAEDETAAVLAAASKRFAAFGASIKKLTERSGLPKVSEAFKGVKEAMHGVVEAAEPFLEVMGILSGLAVATTMVGFAEGIKKSTERLEQLWKVSKAVGVSLQSMRRFEFMAEMKGMDWAAAVGGMRHAATAFDEIRTGTGRMYKSLATIEPLLANQIRGTRNATQAMNLMINAVHNAIAVGNKARAQRLSEMFFGTGAFMAVASLNAKQVAEMSKRADELLGTVGNEAGAAMSELNESFLEVQMSMRGLSDAMAVQLTKIAIPEATKGLATLIAKNREWIATGFGDAVKSVVTWLEKINWSDIGHSFKVFGDGVQWTAKQLGGWGNVMLLLAAIPLAPLAIAVISLADAVLRLGAAFVAFPMVRLAAFGAVAAYVAYKDWEKLGPLWNNTAFLMEQAGKKIAGIPEAVLRGNWKEAAARLHEANQDIRAAGTEFLAWDAEFTRAFKEQFGIRQSVDLMPSFSIGLESGRKFRAAMKELVEGPQSHHPGTKRNVVTELRVMILNAISDIKAAFNFSLYDMGVKIVDSLIEGIKNRLIAAADAARAMAKAIGDAVMNNLPPILGGAGPDRPLAGSADKTGPNYRKRYDPLGGGFQGNWPKTLPIDPELAKRLRMPSAPTPKAAAPAQPAPAPIIIPQDLLKSLQLPSAPRTPSGFGGASGSDKLGGGAGVDMLGVASKLGSAGVSAAKATADAVRESGDRSAAGSLAVAQQVRSLSTAVQQLAAWLARLQDMGGTGGPTGTSGEGFGAGGGVGSAGYGEPGGGGPGSRQRRGAAVQPPAFGQPGGGGPGARTKAAMQNITGNDVAAPGEAGQYRPKYKVTDADLSDAVVNTVAGEARMSSKPGIDAVINNMFNRLGTKAYGPSGDLRQVARAPGQYAGYRHATEQQAAYIRERIKAIASGAVPDNTKGSNEYRATSYVWGEGRYRPWARNWGIPHGADIGGNTFARNPAGGVSPYAAYSDEQIAKRKALAEANKPKPVAAASQPVPVGKSTAEFTQPQAPRQGSLHVKFEPVGAKIKSVNVQHFDDMDMNVGVDNSGSTKWRHGGAVP